MWTLTLQPWKPRDISHKPKGHRRYVNRPVAITNCWTMVCFSNPGPGGMSKPSKSIELEEIRRKLSSCWLIPQERTCWNANIQWTPRPRSCAGQWLLGSLQREGELCQRAWRLVVFKTLGNMPLHPKHTTGKSETKPQVLLPHHLCFLEGATGWTWTLGTVFERFMSYFFHGLIINHKWVIASFFLGIWQQPSKKHGYFWQDVKNWS